MLEPSHKQSHNYSEEYFEHIETGYYPFSFLRDKVIAHFVRKLIPKGHKILDLGCGTGRFISLLKDDFETYGMDISEWAIKEAKKRNCSTVFLNHSLEHSDMFKFQFDGIVAINVIEHFNNPKSCLEKLHLNIRPGGFLFIHMPVASNQISKYLLDRFYHDETHVFIPSIKQLNALLDKTGFSLISERSGSFIFLPSVSRMVLEMTPVYFGIYKKRQ